MVEDIYTISPASLAEIPPLLRQMTATEGWNLCTDAAAAWLAHDPDCFLVGRLNGETIATIIAIRYGESYGFLGCYWVCPAHRRRGFGIRIFRAAVARLSGRNIGLTAVAAEVPQYKKSGFAADANSDAVQRGRAVHRAVAARIVAYDAALFDAVAAYDRAVFPSARATILREWLGLPGAARVCLEDGAVRGFAVLHSGVLAPEISPCFADSVEIALDLVASLANEVPVGEAFKITVATGNPAAKAFLGGLAEYELVAEDVCQRMHTRGQPDIDLGKIWCAMSMDSG
jgi:GNAT superfamily N-acetyltransferase